MAKYSHNDNVHSKYQQNQEYAFGNQKLNKSRALIKPKKLCFKNNNNNNS